MQFYVIPVRGKGPPPGAVYPCVTLEKDRWNDFGWVTQFHVRHWPSPSASEPLGPTKILRRVAGDIQVQTELDDEFGSLDIHHCSLGQERRYYSYLKSLGSEGEEILVALRDIVYKPDVARAFQDEAAFKDSLLRYSEATDNIRAAGELFGHTPEAIAGFLFGFTWQASGFDKPHEVGLDFSVARGLPYRVMAFVGKNGTGKTAVMAELARQLSGVANLKADEHGFSPEKPSFSRVIAVSYSPFGPFRYPRQSTSSYRYCGLFDRRGRMNGKALAKRLIEAIVEIHEEDREIPWFAVLDAAGLFANEPSLEVDLRENPRAVDGYKILTRLSSGHFYAAAVLTEVTANLLERSLVLLDEPELYLHPNMVSGLMRALDGLLDAYGFDSYAVVATHSPIVAQEIPARNVRRFVRDGNDPYCVPLEFESFGENLTAITNEVFGATRADKNYMRILERLSKDRTEAQIEALFGGGLSLNAAAYVRALKASGREGLVE